MDVNPRFRTEDFNFHLPERQIAKTPTSPRDACRLFVIKKSNCTWDHRQFFHLPDFLSKDDVLVFNNSKVIPARIRIKDLNIEILLLREIQTNVWLTIGKNLKKLKEEQHITSDLKAKILEQLPTGEFKIHFTCQKRSFLEILNEIGETPLPPYIKKSTAKLEDYQTIYAQINGSAAAPTAGLHFTPALLSKIQAKGVQIEYVTLHVGLGTFKPITATHINDHQIHEEFYEMSGNTAKRLNEAIKNGKRIIAVGTTSARVLESNYLHSIGFQKFFGSTQIYIQPGYEWKVVKGLITNFHTPKSSLLVLVSSLIGYRCLQKTYGEAIKKGYRFYSFGDAMFIMP